MLPVYGRRKREIPRYHRLFLTSICLFLIVLVALSFLVPLREVPHFSSYLNSKWNNYRDDGIGHQVCRLRKSPIVLVETETSSLVVFESTCPQMPKFTLWQHDTEQLDIKLEIKLELPLSESIDSSHYAWIQRIGKITPNRNYSYQISLRDVYSSPMYKFTFTFTASPPSVKKSESKSDVLKLALVSDSQDGVIEFKQHLSHISAENPSLLIHTGDIIQNSDQIRQWQLYWFDPIRVNLDRYDASDWSIRQIPLLVFPGNHDIPFSKSYGLVGGYRKLKIRDTIWLHLDWTDSPQMKDWFSEQIQSEEWTTALYRVIVCHIPPFIEYWDPATWARGENSWGAHVREFYLPLAKKHKLDVILGGHSHIYQHGLKDGIHYFVIGGGGGGLEDTRVEDYGIYTTTLRQYHHIIIELIECEFIWKVFDVSGNVIHRVALSRSRCAFENGDI